MNDQDNKIDEEVNGVLMEELFFGMFVVFILVAGLVFLANMFR